MFASSVQCHHADFRDRVQAIAQANVQVVGPVDCGVLHVIVDWKTITHAAEHVSVAIGQSLTASGEDVKFAIADALQRAIASHRNLVGEAD